jgi:hypothetical protein
LPAISRQPRVLAQDAFAKAVSSVWDRRLGMSLHAISVGARTEFTVSAGLPLGRGGSHGNHVVFLCAPEAVAMAAAAKVLGLHADELSPADIDDTFAELVLEIGWEIREKLPEVDSFGQAFVVHGNGLGTAIPGAGLLCEAGLVSTAGPVYASLWGPRPIRVPRQTPR